jgi:hypothetical protein
MTEILKEIDDPNFEEKVLQAVEGAPARMPFVFQ